MEKGKRVSVQERADKVRDNDAKAAQDRDLGIKFEATKILVGYFASSGSDPLSGAKLAVEVNAFLKGVSYE